MNPFLLSPRPGSELCPLFLRPGGGHKGKRNKELCSLFLRPGGGHKGERNNDGAGGVIICAWWHYEGRSLCLPVLLSPRSGSELCPLFLCPGGGHKGERNNDGAGGAEKGGPKD